MLQYARWDKVRKALEGKIRFFFSFFLFALGDKGEHREWKKNGFSEKG